MKGRLPEYLCLRVDARPLREQVFTCGDVRLTVITPRLIRIERGAWTDQATLTVLCRALDACACETSEADGVLTLTTGALEVRCDPRLPLEDGLTIRSLGEMAFTWRFGQKPLQNLGGTTSTLDQIDGPCPLEDGVCAIDGFAFIDDSETPLMREDGWFAPREAGTDVYFFGYGHDYPQCVRDYCRLTGETPMLPAFALGNWWSRYHAYTADEYLGLMDRFAARDVPLSVGIVDMDWHLTSGEGRTYKEGWTGYTWNEALFPDYRAFIKALHARGLKTALNLHPADGVRTHERAYEAMALAMGMDPEEKKPIPFNCLNPDFLRAYFEVLHFPYEADGIDFWWLDWQQGGDYARIVGEGYKPCGLEAITPLWMLNHMHYLASRRTGQRGMIFSRFSGYGSQRFPIGFSGDTYVTWDSLRFQPYFTVTASNIGYGWWSHDIGGHMGGRRDDELTTRWVQFGVFSPIFRLHSSDSIFNCREPWMYNPRAERVMEHFMRLRHRLFPYLYTMNRRCASEQIPLMRPMYHTHPEERDAYQVRNQYWFGSEMVVAPITDPADESGLGRAEVFLPEGRWTDAFTGYAYRGGQRLEVFRPLEQMPVFLKAGALVPMQAHVPGSAHLGSAESMTLYVAPGASGALTLYEDDGESLDYLSGRFSETPLTLEWQTTEAALTIGPAQDRADVTPTARRWEVCFIGFAKGCRFETEGRTLEAVYDPQRNAFTVVLEDVRADRGAWIVVRREAGLCCDNSDGYARCIDLLTRAQLPLAVKIQLHDRLNKALERSAKGLAIRPGNLASDQYRSVGRALYELVMQTNIQ